MVFTLLCSLQHPYTAGQNALLLPVMITMILSQVGAKLHAIVFHTVFDTKPWKQYDGCALDLLLNTMHTLAQPSLKEA